ncbi:Putative oxidoreductase YteT [Psilocybe cubensis]|uniref:Gfo/Idh/MocA-like oxidoreductase N-terminal domain-containing protein n=2 Tax=Psilocybe cubensis TaxID=181762 RepID=A0A8H8CL49_PSICU|nr:Putative oxidoreductase YteT [Psilocybe cubensis]KAH9482833.1 Putative oxidoreductase YteT [Psilocybe cubensis]
MSSLLNNTKSLWRRSIRLPKTSSDSSSKAGTKPGPAGTGTDHLVTIAVIGCGQRGKAYTRYALACPDRCKVVAIAEPRPKTQKYFADLHQVDQTLVFNTWQELHAASAETISTVGKRLADAVLIAVQDHLHAEVAVAFADQGYHILCEKPMATNLEDCIAIDRAIKDARKIFGMGHVMRYSPYSREITEIIRSGSLGELINIVQVEPVGYYHFAHSYVRGNWASEEASSFSLMTKCCHDIDLICHWFYPAIPIKVSSFGSLRHFRKSAKPPGAGDATRCMECPAEKECPYSAKKIYLDEVSQGHVGWPASAIVDGIPDIENITEALKKGSYGLCVYESANDVCDNQVVNIEFSNGSTASFTMVAFTEAICDRRTRLHFSHGEIIGDMNTFTVNDFKKRTSKVHHPKSEGGGHGGGDMGLIRSFVDAVLSNEQELLGTNSSEILKSHLTVFAAEASRREGVVIDCVDFEKKARDRWEQANV